MFAGSVRHVRGHKNKTGFAQPALAAQLKDSSVGSSVGCVRKMAAIESLPEEVFAAALEGEIATIKVGSCRAETRIKASTENLTTME